jgi:mono/diheme cytochrome c family protein
MKWIYLALAATVALVLVRPAMGDRATAPDTSATPARAPLRNAESFASIKAKNARSLALFNEAGKVLLHPRCVNCHPAGDSPLQGEAGRVHEPPVQRGTDGFGALGMRCSTCHMEENFDPGRVPGAAKWHLAPKEMAWEGKTLGDICRQIKDPARNGGLSMEALIKHMSEDTLVGWAWAPGADRQPAPGDQQTFGGLIRAWAESGAVCPR